MILIFLASPYQKLVWPPTARNDPRVVVADPDPQARYYGIELGERTLLPRDDARLSETRFETWLTQSAAKAAGAH